MKKRGGGAKDFIGLIPSHFGSMVAGNQSGSNFANRRHVFGGQLPKLRRALPLHSKKRTTCPGLMKTALNNVLLPTLFKVVNNIGQHCYT